MSETFPTKNGLRQEALSPPLFLLQSIPLGSDKRVPVTIACYVLRLQMEEQPPIWRVAANI